jgi:Rrf2 family protein
MNMIEASPLMPLLLTLVSSLLGCVQLERLRAIMLSLSQTTGYAIRALGCLNSPVCRCRLIADIAKCAGVPKPYLAKIINSLARQGLVTAKRGYKGGISLTRPPEEISLLEIVEAVEGTKWLGTCLLGLPECATKKTCPTHEFWVRFCKDITQELQQATLAQVFTAREDLAPTRSRARASRRSPARARR